MCTFLHIPVFTKILRHILYMFCRYTLPGEGVEWRQIRRKTQRLDSWNRVRKPKTITKRVNYGQAMPKLAIAKCTKIYTSKYAKLHFNKAPVALTCGQRPVQVSHSASRCGCCRANLLLCFQFAWHVRFLSFYFSMLVNWHSYVFYFGFRSYVTVYYPVNFCNFCLTTCFLLIDTFLSKNIKYTARLINFQDTLAIVLEEIRS